MKLRYLTTALLIAASPALLQAGETYREKYDRVFDFQPGTRLVVSNENGSVTVRNWDKNAVRIVAEKRARSSNEEKAREALKSVKIDVHADGRTLVVETDTPDSGAAGFFQWLEGKHVDLDVAYEITVPKSLPLKVSTVNGHIDVAAVGGQLQLSTTNGRIDVAEASGSVDAETTNGRINAELVEVTANNRMSFETTNGGITLALPASIKADVNASTTNGSISSDIPVTTQRADDNSLRGSMNGGGPEITLETTNGSIHIRKAGS
jgi:DUF4097 and DUF4098 domain-containing protein YvlB